VSYVYLLWSYNEYGPEDLSATLDRNKLPDLVKAYNAKGWFDRYYEKGEIPKYLEELLLKTDEELAAGDGIRHLIDGWGGLCLQVTELDKPVVMK